MTAHYMQTPSGKCAWLPGNEAPGDFDDLTGMDLAHMLANVNRFGGALSVPLSVAQHSCNVAVFVANEGGDRQAQLYALLHDAHEPFIGDIPSPTKLSLPPPVRTGMEVYARRVDALIFQRFGLAPDMPSAVKLLVRTADLRALAWEARDLFRHGPVDGWTDNLPQAPADILQPWTWLSAKRRFIAQLRRLGGDAL